MTSKNLLIIGLTPLVIIFLGIIGYEIINTSNENKCLQYYSDKNRKELKLISSKTISGNLWITLQAESSDQRLDGLCVFSDGQVTELGIDIAWSGALVDETESCYKSNAALWDHVNGRYRSRPKNCKESAVSDRAGWIRKFEDGDLERMFGNRK